MSVLVTMVDGERVKEAEYGWKFIDLADPIRWIDDFFSASSHILHLGSAHERQY